MVREVEIEKLNPAKYNPRVELRPGMREWEHLVQSIQEFGLVEPIIWNEKTGNVVGGHQRLEVLRYLGYDTAPCSIVNLDDYDEKLLNIALNKIQGEWDYEKLEEILKDLETEVAELSGFSADEIALILADNEDLLDEDFDYSEWDDEGIAGSYVVTLVFQNSWYAERWSEDNGFEGQIKEGSKSTVIRMEGAENEE